MPAVGCLELVVNCSYARRTGRSVGRSHCFRKCNDARPSERSGCLSRYRRRFAQGKELAAVTPSRQPRQELPDHQPGRLGTTPLGQASDHPGGADHCQQRSYRRDDGGRAEDTGHDRYMLPLRIRFGARWSLVLSRHDRPRRLPRCFTVTTSSPVCIYICPSGTPADRVGTSPAPAITAVRLRRHRTSQIVSPPAAADFWLAPQESVAGIHGPSSPLLVQVLGPPCIAPSKPRQLHSNP